MSFYYDISGFKWFFLNRRTAFGIYKQFSDKLFWQNGQKISLKELKKEFVATNDLGGLIIKTKDEHFTLKLK